MRKAILVAVVAALVGAPGTAGAQPIDCGSFARTQTYHGWGPSLHYGTTVTVVYGVDECSGSWSEETFTYSLSGTASIYEGEIPEGRHPGSGSALDVLPFTSEGSFTDAEGGGWPPAWWSCLSTADVRWQIADVYSFRAAAADGDWTLGINVDGAKPFRWSYSAC